MTAGTPAWYLRRLRGMGPEEVGWRVVDFARQQAWRRRQVHGGAHGRPAGAVAQPSFRSGLSLQMAQDVPKESALATLAAADALLAGKWDVLGALRSDIADPDWFADEVTGVVAPSTAYAFDINPRDEAQVGNIKSLWEVSRHHHLTLLASAFWISGYDAYAEAVDRQLRSWWAKNPFLSGVHWTSGIEVGIRLISWVWIRRLLDGWVGAADLFERNDDALWQIWWHQTYLAGFRSRGSSANNHVIAESAGQLVAANAFPWFAESAAWRNQASGLLQEELHLNTFPSGVNRELATEYHRFVTELGLVAAVEAGAAENPLATRTWELLGRSMDAAAAMVDCAVQPPRQGDGDHGRVLLLDDPHEQGWTRFLGLGEALVDRADWWPAGARSAQSVALTSLHRRRVAVPHAPTRPDRFLDAGLTILRGTDGQGAEIWCRCDGGPHGFLSIAAHAHADALSIEVRHDGVDVLADPGTYCYHGEPDWRTYFRSTLAHNTLEVAGQCQSVSGGAFLWLRHAETRDLARAPETNGLAEWMAEHNGYRRLTPAVTHQRRAQFHEARRTITVEDRVVTTEAVDSRLAWHLGPTVSSHMEDGCARLTWESTSGPMSATLSLPGQLTWSVHRGETDPVRGWYSPSFGVRLPTTTLLGCGRIAGGDTLATTLTFADSTQ